MKVAAVLAMGLLVGLACCQVGCTKGDRVVTEIAKGLDGIVAEGAKVEKLSGGFRFTEGPVWTRDGVLLFSDIPNDRIVQYDPKSGEVSDFRRPCQQTNGHTLDSAGRLVSCEHGGRRISRTEQDGTVVTVVDSYEGKKLNSPNDLVYKSDGALYFTDPPYGLPKQDDDPGKEQPHNGIYRLSPDGKTLTLLATELKRPNGLAFSPDEKTLYVANSDSKRKLWMAYPVKDDGALGPGKVFYDVSDQKADGSPDGMKVDQAGRLFCTGPGGVWVFSAEGKHLGTITPAEVPANLAFGGTDGKTLYMTARTGLYSIRLQSAGPLP